MAGLSAYILTLNNESCLGTALASLEGVADEIVVVDSGSNDRTAEIARSRGARVTMRSFDDFAQQRSFAVSLCTHDWILTIDGDEELSDPLRQRLLAMKPSLGADGTEAYGILREWYFLSRSVHCFYPSRCPDQPIRLFRRDAASYRPERRVHESMSGFRKSAPIDEPIIHHTARSVAEAYGKVNQYTTLAARDAVAAGSRSGWPKILLLPWLLAAKWYFLEGGWRDGSVGVIHALYVRDTAYLKWLKVHYDTAAEAEHNRSRP